MKSISPLEQPGRLLPAMICLSFRHGFRSRHSRESLMEALGSNPFRDIFLTRKTGADETAHA